MLLFFETLETYAAVAAYFAVSQYLKRGKNWRQAPKIDLVLVKGNKKRGKGNGNEKGKEKKKKSEKEIESESMREKGGNAQETGKGNEIGGIKVQKKSGKNKIWKMRKEIAKKRKEKPGIKKLVTKRG